MTDPVKINFRISTDEDGYPPVSAESLWSDALADGYKIDNIPFFTREATIGDVVEAKASDDGTLWFSAIKYRSKHSLIRVVFFEATQKEKIISSLKELGCDVEYMPDFKLAAVDIPEHVELRKVQQLLHQESLAGVLDYEEPILRQPPHQ
jgi:hypothetical protein